MLRQHPFPRFLVAALATTILSCNALAVLPGKRLSEMNCVNTGTRTLNRTEAEFTQMYNAGFRYVRADLTWRDIEKTKGVYNFSFWDPRVAMIKRQKLKIVFVLGYENPLYETDNPDPNVHDRGLATDAGRVAFANFALKVAEHFKSEPDIIFEIWNEADGEPFWGGSEESRRVQYMDLVNKTVVKMRQGNPNVHIIAGGVTMLSWQNSKNFLTHCISNGLLTKVNALAIHNYSGLSDNNTPERVHAEMAWLRDLMKKHGASPTFPVYCTEFGIDVNEMTGTDEERLLKQSQRATRYTLNAAVAGMGFINWYQWTVADRADHEGFGLKRQNGTLRPVYNAMKTLMSLLSGYSYEQRIAGPTASEFIAVFKKDTTRRIAVWASGGTTFPNVTVPVRNLGFTGTTVRVYDIYGVMTTLSVVNGNVVIKSSASVQYVLP